MPKGKASASALLIPSLSVLFHLFLLVALPNGWWLVQWFEATETTYYRAVDFSHTLCLGGICSCSLDSWLYNFYSRLGVEDMDVGAPPELIYRWDRTANTDKEMLMHMSSMHRTWRGVLKKQHYTGKSFDDDIASVPAGVNPHDWQIMCAKWNTSDEQNITDRNKANRSHQSMPYRKGRKSHYLLKDDFRLAHDRESNRVEIFKIGKCKELPDGNEQWVDDESRSRYERMIQLSTLSLDSNCGSTPISAEEAFVSVMGKDRSGRIRCRGSRETRRTWHGTREGPTSTDYQQQISNIENTLRMKVEELRIEARRRDSEMDEMQRELE
ncbi:hypothetical protein Taro_049943 [Colocasia esculenta]|uniref:Uncharacterized protein n=1 Tax=Colocasia esculenta TaxID=4460 RepID=A0A843XC51_COLES|nr:hypothetical protein [Colocasia esculenta]